MIEYRKQFPVTNRMIYLDAARSVCPPKCVVEAVKSFYSGMSEEGEDRKRWEVTADEVREKFARLIHASSDEIAIIRNTTEGLNIAANGLPLRSGDNVITTDLEHLNNVYPWINLQARKGIEVRILRSREGRLLIKDLRSLVDNRTRALAISFVTSGGLKVDLKNYGQFCRENDIYFVVDGIQGIGRLSLNVQDCLVDIMACGGHKGLLAGHGIGCLFVSERILSSLDVTYAGPPSELRHEPVSAVFKQASGAKKFHIGSPNYSGIHALSAGLALLDEIGISTIESYDLHLGWLLADGLKRVGVRILSPLSQEEFSSIISFTTPNDIQVADLLEANKIRVTCRADGIRVSPHFYNTEEEIVKAVEIVEKAVKGLI